MNQSVKKLLIIGAGLFIFTGAGAEINGATRSVRASMAKPEFFHSTSHRDNVYYGVGRNRKGKKINYLIYGRMPKAMQKRGHIFGLYYGRKYDREVGHHHSSLNRIVRRHGQTYLPDYVGYTAPRNQMRYRGRRAYIEDVFVNQRDIARPVKHGHRSIAHDHLHTIKYRSLARHSHHKMIKTHRHHYRKPRIKRHRVKRTRIRRNRKHRIKETRTVEAPRLYKDSDWDENGYPTGPALNDASNDLIKDINDDRESHGVRPVSSAGFLNHIATHRAGQLFTRGFTHYDNNGKMLLTDDAAQDGDSLGTTWGENIGNTSGYSEQTAHQIADTFNKMLFTNEKGATPAQDGGHRKNILNPSFTKVGVGMKTDGNGTTNIAEDFCN